MRRETVYSFAIGAASTVPAGWLLGRSGAPWLIGVPVGYLAALAAAFGFDVLSRRRIRAGTCESCGRPAAVELADRSLWCRACDASAERLGYPDARW